MSFTIPAQALSALMVNVVGKEKTHKYLNVVRIVDDGGRLRLVATDGHLLATFETDTPTPKDFKPVSLGWAGKIPANADKVTVSLDGNGASLSMEDANGGFMGALPGTTNETDYYPDWTRVATPTTGACDIVALDAEILARFGKLIKSTQESGTKGAHVALSVSPDGMYGLRCQRWAGVIAGSRWQLGETGVPSYQVSAP